MLLLSLCSVINVIQTRTIYPLNTVDYIAFGLSYTVGTKKDVVILSRCICNISVFDPEVCVLNHTCVCVSGCSDCG